MGGTTPTFDRRFDSVLWGGRGRGLLVVPLIVEGPRGLVGGRYRIRIPRRRDLESGG